MEIWRLPQAHYVDNVRWLPPWPGSPRLLALAVWDSLTRKPFLQLKALQENPEMVEQQQLQSSSPWLLETQNSWSLPARSTTFKVSPSQDHQHTVVASASSVGSLSVFLLDAMNPSADEADLSPFTCEKLHRGAVAGLDIQRGGAPDCITVGIDGKINLVKVGQNPQCWWPTDPDCASQLMVIPTHNRCKLLDDDDWFFQRFRFLSVILRVFLGTGWTIRVAGEMCAWQSWRIVICSSLLGITCGVCHSRTWIGSSMVGSPTAWQCCCSISFQRVNTYWNLKS